MIYCCFRLQFYNMTNILIAAGNAPLSRDWFTRLSVLGGGAPVWERSSELGFGDNGNPRVAVVMKLDPTGIKGSRFVANGTVTINLEARRIFCKAAHSAYK